MIVDLWRVKMFKKLWVQKKRPEGLYLITFKNGTRGYYDWKCHLDHREHKAKWIWLKTFPFANYGQFKDYDEWIKMVDEIIPVLTEVGGPVKDPARPLYANQDQFEVYKKFKESYFKTMEQNGAFSHGLPEKEEEDPILKLFNLWISNAQTQESIDNFITPMYGYTDLEVEDLGYLLEKAFRGGIEMFQVALQQESFEQSYEKLTGK